MSNFELNGIEDSPVSAATVGAGIGYLFGPVGLVAGAAIGAIVDVYIGAKRKKEERKAAKKAFLAALLKRYNQQVFISSLQRVGSGMVYLSALGLKPGSEQFDQMLVKKLSAEVGYKGKCALELYGPAPPGKPRKVIASISRSGKLTAYSPHIDQALGPKWAEACKELHKAALQAWAEDQKQNILLERDIQKDKDNAQRNTITRLLVNGGIIMLLMGYTLKQKKKLGKMRGIRKKKWHEKKAAASKEAATSAAKKGKVLIKKSKPSRKKVK